jgi:bifunctional pyridoxal-dependent enzyme with beta-cystathionase and maltose regulon repressor activities
MRRTSACRFVHYFEYVEEPIVSVLLNYAGANGVRQAEIHMAEGIVLRLRLLLRMLTYINDQVVISSGRIVAFRR